MAKLPWAHIVGLGLVWTVLVWVGLNYRPLMPIDETRYLSVAWEMWLRTAVRCEPDRVRRLLLQRLIGFLQLHRVQGSPTKL